MLNAAEIKLLNSDNTKFPMIKAASAALKKCGTCGHKNVNIHTMLRVAVTKYAKDPAFVEHCRNIAVLPCMIGGILIK